MEESNIRIVHFKTVSTPRVESEDTVLIKPIRICEYIDSNNYDTAHNILNLNLLSIDIILCKLKSATYLDNIIVKQTAVEKCEVSYVDYIERKNNIVIKLRKVSPDDANIKIYAKYYNFEYVKMYGSKTCQECNQKLEKQDLLNNKYIEFEGESMNKSTITNTEILKLVNSFLKGSEIVNAENGAEHTLPTLLPTNEVEVVKQSLKRVEVYFHKPLVGLTEIVKPGAVVCKTDEKNDIKRNDYDVDYHETQLMEQLFTQQNFHIKTPVYEIYMAPSFQRHPIAINGILWDSLKAELWRLHTYSSYPHSAKKSAILLAEEGFAYIGSGKDDSVICCFCCATKQSWQSSDLISEVHKSLSPGCSMVTKVNCNNIPMTEPSNGQTLFRRLYNLNKTNINVDNRQKTGHNESVSDIENDCENGSHPAEDRPSQLVVPTESKRNNNLTQVPEQFAMENQTLRSPSSPITSTSQEAARLTSRQPELIDTQSVAANRNELNAPRPSVIPNRTLTEASNQGNGSNTSSANTTLVSTATGATVQTSASNRQQSSVTTSSNIIQSVQNPSATTAPNPSATNQSNTTPQESSQTGTGDTQNTPRVAGKGPTYGELGIITERPKRYEYAVRATRFATFDPWPRDHHLKKEDLADAGFYFAGYGDCARCFYCGGGLRNWEDDDNVWVEHARWFPKCAYIRQTMGQQFVDAVQELNRDCDKITFKMATEKIGASAAFLHLDTKSMPLKRDPAVLTVVDMGYSQNDVLEAATYIKEKYGMLSADKIFDKLEKDRKPRASKEAVPNIQPSQYTSDVSKDGKTLKKLKEENSQLRQQTVCKICMDKEVAVVFLPCGHFVSCTDCASAMKDCPVCRKSVRGIVRAFVG